MLDRHRLLIIHQRTTNRPTDPDIVGWKDGNACNACDQFAEYPGYTDISASDLPVLESVFGLYDETGAAVLG